LDFADKTVMRSLLSGTKRLTLREGKRIYAQYIKVEGHPAKVEKFFHTTLLHIPFDVLVRNGHRNMFDTLMTMKKFYPLLTINSLITVVEFRIVI